MSKFTDSQGRAWVLVVNVGAIKATREALDLDLADASPSTIDRLAEDFCLLVDVLWVLCKKQADALGVNSEQFGESLVGDPIDEAASALIKAIVDFFPGQRKLLLRKATEKATEVRSKAEALALAKLDDPELMAQVTEAMEARMNADIEATLTRLNSPTS